MGIYGQSFTAGRNETGQLHDVPELAARFGSTADRIRKQCRALRSKTYHSKDYRIKRYVLTDSEVEQIAAGVGIGSSWTDYSGANAYRVHKAAGDGMVATLAELNRAGLVCDGNLSEIAIPIDMAWVNEDKLTSERQFGKRTVYVYPVSEFRPSGVHNEPERVAAGATASQQAYFNRCSAYYRGLQTRCFNYERESYEREIEREMWRADDDNAQVVVTGGGYDSIYPELSELF